MDTEESENDDGEESETNDNRTPLSFSLYNDLNGWNISDIIINAAQLVACHASNYNLQQQTDDNPAREEENVLSTPREHPSNATIFEIPDNDNCTDNNDSCQQSQMNLRANAMKHHTSASVVPIPTPVAPSLTYSDGPRRSKRRRRKPRDSLFEYTRLRRIARPARPARAGHSTHTARTARSHNIRRRASCRLVPGRTPLHLAIHLDAVELVEMLVVAGADVNAPDERGRSPLQLATAHQNMQIVRALLGSGARGAAARRRGKGRKTNVSVTAGEI